MDSTKFVKNVHILNYSLFLPISFNSVGRSLVYISISLPPIFFSLQRFFQAIRISPPIIHEIVQASKFIAVWFIVKSSISQATQKISYIFLFPTVNLWYVSQETSQQRLNGLFPPVLGHLHLPTGSGGLYILLNPAFALIRPISQA